ncbi:alpha-glucan family phosphorylase [bacterium]|nr:alpha-glucan family phosphorylase [bacterium]
MNRLHTLHVVPSLPKKLERLRDIAFNMHWTWDHDAIELFMRLDPEFWRDVKHNPVRMLSEISQERLEEVANDDAFLGHLDRTWKAFQEYDKERGWFKSKYPDQSKMSVAYFSAEFGLHECLPIYSGGLGLLAGDHLKAASDLNVPLVGIGLLYQRGYFRQYLNADGWQQEHYPTYDFYNMPLEMVRNGDDEPKQFTIPVGGREVTVFIWRVRVGRVDLYLLDTNVRTNHPEDREITQTLYGGDSEMRVRQEIVLGIGGIHALELLGINANIFHMNEGHSAFLALERIRRLMVNDKLTFSEAREAARAGQVFTTHTPVPAGIDQFGQDLIVKYFQNFWPQLGMDRAGFLGLGGADPHDQMSPFNMATLAINLASYTNGVSKLHAEVSRKMWHKMWPKIGLEEVPIHAITNGVHARSWISSEMSHLFDRHLGPTWQENPQDHDLWKRVKSISTEELWRTRERMRGRLISYARDHVRQQLERRGESRSTIERARDVLDMDTLTIGFARRFATYKRGTLLFSDPERLIKLVSDPERPVQIIIAGKAHPKDEPGKKMIRDIVHFARDEQIRRRIVFLEDYDVNVARHLVQGCDVWLNNPRPPMEASGTSGMKAAVNGVLNCSTFDGWWAEGYDPEIGWTIGHGEEYDDTEVQDKIESDLLYDILEKEIVPLFYNRDQGRVAREWTDMMKRMLEKTCPVFITTRMVSQYTREAYLPSYTRSTELAADQYSIAKNIGEWEKKVTSHWHQVSVAGVESDRAVRHNVGDRVHIKASIQLGSLAPEDVRVEIFQGVIGGDRQLEHAEGIAMELTGQAKEGIHLYEGSIDLQTSGMHGFAVRVLPYHEHQVNPHSTGLVVWEP